MRREIKVMVMVRVNIIVKLSVTKKKSVNDGFAERFVSNLARALQERKSGALGYGAQFKCLRGWLCDW